MCFFEQCRFRKGVKVMMNEVLPPDRDANGERREYERFSCTRMACSCFVRSESGDGPRPDRRRGGAVLSNVSPDGVSFETNFMLDAGDCLRLEVRPIEGPELSARIRVLHSRQSEKKGFFAVGSRFEEISESDRRNLLQLIATINRMRHDLSL